MAPVERLVCRGQPRHLGTVCVGQWRGGTRRSTLVCIIEREPTRRLLAHTPLQACALSSCRSRLSVTKRWPWLPSPRLATSHSARCTHHPRARPCAHRRALPRASPSTTRLQTTTGRNGPTSLIPRHDRTRPRLPASPTTHEIFPDFKERVFRHQVVKNMSSTRETRFAVCSISSPAFPTNQRPVSLIS